MPTPPVTKLLTPAQKRAEAREIMRDLLPDLDAPASKYGILSFRILKNGRVAALIGTSRDSYSWITCPAEKFVAAAKTIIEGCEP